MTVEHPVEPELDLLRAGFDLGQLPIAGPDLVFWVERVAEAMRVAAGAALGSWTERAVALHARDELANKVAASGPSPWGDHTFNVLAAQQVLVDFDARYAALLKHFGDTGQGAERWRLAGRVAQIPVQFWETFKYLERQLPDSGDDPYEAGSSIPFCGAPHHAGSGRRADLARRDHRSGHG